MPCWRATPAPDAAAKPIAARQLAGQSTPRIDIPDKVFGRPRFIHDRAFDGLLHGRVLRPAVPGAKLQSLDASAAERMPGVVAVVRDGSFVGVVAETEPAAVAAIAAAAQRRRTGAMASSCPTRRGWPTGCAAALSRRPPSTSARPPSRRPSPARCGTATRGRSSRMPRWRRPAPWRAGASRRSRCGRTCRASSTCAPTSPSSSRVRRTASSSSTWRAPAASARTAPTMSRSTPCCWPAPCRAVRCACNGRARTR